MLKKALTQYFKHRRSVLFTHLDDVMCSRLVYASFALKGVNKHPMENSLGKKEERFETKG